MVACLDEHTFDDYFDFALTPEETSRLFDHIDECTHCADRFAAMASARSQHPDLTAALAESLAEPERILGRYRIERVLGMGAMGVVYAGRDPDLDRKVAIKLLRPSARVSPELLRARLQREAQAMARLSHPNVIHVHEIGTFGEQVFVVMELIDGTTLAEWLREKPRSWREVVNAFVAAGEGLAAAHRAGIVHRDFKPDNVLVSRTGRICVTDFGLARIQTAGEEPSESSPPPTFDPAITYSGLLVGTPAYMSPEQMRGEATDARSDLFSFCVALYEALCETRPYPGKTLEELRASSETGRLEPPRRAVPGWVRRPVERGLSPTPAARPPSMDRLLDQLRRDPARRRRSLVALVAMLLVVGGLFFQQRAARRSRLCTGAERQLAGVWDGPRRQQIERSFTGAKLRRLTRILDERARGWVAMHTSACEATRLHGEQSEELLDLRMQCLHDRLGELRVFTDVLATSDSKSLEQADDAAAALPALAQCADIAALRADERLPADPPLRAQIEELKSNMARAHVLHNLGRYADAVAIASTAIDHPASQRHLPLRAHAFYVRGMSLSGLSRYDDAVPELKQAASIGLRSHQDHLVLQSWNHLATIVGFYGHHLDEALGFLELSGALAARMRRDDLEMRRLQALADIYSANDRPREAEDAARRSLAIAERVLSPDDTDLAISLDVVGDAAFESHKLEEAAALYGRAVAIYNRTGEQQINGALASSNLADTLVELGRYPEALAAAQHSLELREKLLPADDWQIGSSLMALARPLFMLGRLDEADAALQRLRRVVEKNPDRLPRTAKEEQSLRGRILLARGDAAAASPLLERAMADGSSLSTAVRAETELALARSLWQLGKNRRRAVDLATDAAKLARDYAPSPTFAAEVDAWLKSHP